eukprot:CAMPEP_0183360838 /NCGR_PEP_ID=MMETSP0164_2-20130417/56104_1 /TAXON_ID=221442 /ORGANISM="Coccolithus pelagicus ssp braarudi, Strain PLY182g" /LENGTH=147 /DNA_ID=CAMNT_0025535277 /DNA_START=267 /DNA_END=710 /DNA_ORIENTATION=-
MGRAWVVVAFAFLACSSAALDTLLWMWASRAARTAANGLNGSFRGLSTLPSPAAARATPGSGLRAMSWTHLSTRKRLMRCQIFTPRTARITLTHTSAVCTIIVERASVVVMASSVLQDSWYCFSSRTCWRDWWMYDARNSSASVTPT